MTFIHKLIILITAITILVICQMYLDDIGFIEFSFLTYKGKLGIFAVLALLLAKTSVVFLVKNCSKLFVKLALNKQLRKENEEITQIAKLIVTDDSIIKEKISNLQISEKFAIIKKALALKSRAPCQMLTNIPELDIIYFKQQIKTEIEKNNIKVAGELFNEAMRLCPTQLDRMQKEILDLYEKANENNINLNFNPNKSKYNLPQEFVDEYYIIASLSEFHSACSPDRKLKIISKLYKKFPNSSAIRQEYLQYLYDTNAKNIDEIIIDMCIRAPDRNFVKYIRNKNELAWFEQKLAIVSDSNSEKLWILLELATNSRNYSKIKEIIAKMKHVDEEELAKYVYKYFDILTKDNHIVKLLPRHE